MCKWVSPKIHFILYIDNKNECKLARVSHKTMAPLVEKFVGAAGPGGSLSPAY